MKKPSADPRRRSPARGARRGADEVNGANVHETVEPFRMSVWAAASFARRTNNKHQIEVFLASYPARKPTSTRAFSAGRGWDHHLGLSFVVRIGIR